MQKGQALIFLLIGILIIAVAGGAFYLGRQTTPIITSQTPAPAPTINSIPKDTDETDNWFIFKDNYVIFKLPSKWVENSRIIGGGVFNQEFKDPAGKYLFTFSNKGNYSQVTGKPYLTIDEVISMPYKVKVVTIDGQEGRQPLPRAGSENINSVAFFSKDSKTIYTLWLKTGNTALNTSETEVKQGQKLFDQILSTFKFTN